MPKPYTPKNGSVFKIQIFLQYMIAAGFQGKPPKINSFSISTIDKPSGNKKICNNFFLNVTRIKIVTE